jgi:hypothetical protein
MGRKAEEGEEGEIDRVLPAALETVNSAGPSRFVLNSGI